MKKKHLIYLLIICSFISACRNENKKVITTVNKWMGKEIIIPQNIQLYSRINNTIKLEDILAKEFKILFYVNSSECFKCKARLADWNKLIYNFNQLYQDKVGFLFFYNINDNKEVYDLLEYERFNYPIIIENQLCKINELNKIPDDDDFKCFLLDRSNRIISIGNPTINPKVQSLYKRYINKEKKHI